jgi:hypothetical protein
LERRKRIQGYDTVCSGSDSRIIERLIIKNGGYPYDYPPFLFA